MHVAALDNLFKAKLVKHTLVKHPFIISTLLQDLVIGIETVCIVFKRHEAVLPETRDAILKECTARRRTL